MNKFVGVVKWLLPELPKLIGFSYKTTLFLERNVVKGYQIYLDSLKEYEKIALIDAGSNFAFKDPVILFDWQSNMYKATVFST